MEGSRGDVERSSHFCIFKKRRTELFSTGYMILKSFDDSLYADSRAQRSAAPPLMFDEATSLEALFDYMMLFLGEEVLKDPAKRDLWNVIFNAVVKPIDEVDRDREIKLNTSTKRCWWWSRKLERMS